MIRSRVIAGFHGMDTAMLGHREDAPGVTTRREELALDAKPSQGASWWRRRRNWDGNLPHDGMDVPEDLAQAH